MRRRIDTCPPQARSRDYAFQDPATREEPPLDTTALATPYHVVAGLLGGIGLFLLGMHMLTEGLKLAAGRALEGLLERGTATPVRGLGAGMTMTALVQSSTAVTVASIGFVNTGLLSLQNAMWVIFGSNVGTTLNAWLVAALGFSFRIDAFALPFVGIGAVLMLARPHAAPARARPGARGLRRALPRHRRAQGHLLGLRRGDEPAGPHRAPASSAG